jgi:hypothetical protein
MKNRIEKTIIIAVALFVPCILSSQSWELVGLSGLNLRAVAVHPANPNTVLASDHSSIYRSVNGGADWDSVASISACHLLFHELFSDTAFAIFGDGTYSDGIWRSVDGGETFSVLKFLYRASSLAIPFWVSGHMFAGQDSLEGVWMSTDDGQTWNAFNDSLVNRFVKSVHCVKLSDSTYVPLAGTAMGIYFCTNQGFWVKSDAPGDLPAVDFDGGLEPAQSVYAAIDGGSWSDGVYISNNHGTNWTVSWYWPFMTAVQMNPLNGQVIFAADSGYGVIMTTNGGASWTEINSNLGDLRVRDLAMSRGDTVHLYAATCSGLYRYGPPSGSGDDNGSPPSKLQVTMPTIGFSGSSVPLYCTVPEEYVGKEILLTITDVSGRRRATKSMLITDQHMEMLVYLSHPAGVYFLNLATERLIDNSKLVILSP